MKKTLLFAVAVAGVLSFTASANAGEPLMSPRAKDQADSLRKVPGTTTDTIDRSIKPGSPKAIAQAESLRRVPSASSAAVAAVGYRATGDDGITASPKARQQLDERGSHVMIAPLK
jgi:hypothetical protein